MPINILAASLGVARAPDLLRTRIAGVFIGWRGNWGAGVAIDPT